MSPGGRSSWIAGGLGGVMAGALALNLLLVGGLVLLLATRGLAHFVQEPVVQLELTSGERVLGEVRTPLGARDGADRLRLRVGRGEPGDAPFRWLDRAEVASETEPPEVALIERRQGGRIYGFAEALVRVERPGGPARTLASDASLWPAVQTALPRKRAQIAAIERFERERIAPQDAQLARLDDGSPEARRALERVARESRAELEELRRDLAREQLQLRTVDGAQVAIALADVVRAVRPNQLSWLDRVGLYLDRVRELLLEEPRAANTEGGLLPAIFGTVLMVLLTSLAVAPLGVLTAIYLREYARRGLLVRAVRTAVSSLAGIPSIVVGVFGLGFFVYGLGGSLDQLLFADRLPAPTFGTGGILWASLTLALLTVPVVVVSTEEGLAAVPRSVREGSFALGATRFETLRRVVLPAALPGALTGLILAMSRAAGEVAPLMIVGTVKLAPDLPIDGEWPFLHLERKFMHLGFHIYDTGFQSPNAEAAQPLVFATALLLVAVVLVTNLSAILLRNRLRRRYAASAVE